MKTLDRTGMQLRQEEIAARALHRWEVAGHHHHHDLEIWLEAEAKLGAPPPPERVRENVPEAGVVRPSVEGIRSVLAPAW